MLYRIEEVKQEFKNKDLNYHGELKTWKGGIEEYVNTLHYEVDEQTKLSKVRSKLLI